MDAKKPNIVIVGAGFAGYHCAQALSKKLAGRATISLLNPTDFFLYLPLLPQVTGGLLDPRRITVSLPDTLRKVELAQGRATKIDFDARRVDYTDSEDNPGELAYDRLVLAAGSVNKLLPIPGLAENAHGFRGMPEALYLHDHLTRQMELAESTDDPEERRARMTFVVVGAGYTGTEVLAHGQRLTESIRKTRPRLAKDKCRWILLDTADRVLPGLDKRLGRTADRVLRRRDVEVRMGTSVKEATADGVHLSDGDFVASRTLVWCVGVKADPFIDSLGKKTAKGRLVVDEYLTVQDNPDVFACGDAAAVPDLTRPGEVTAMTAQHAERQGKLAAVNVAASLGFGTKKAYRHHDLGFTVDLAGGSAAANPFGVPLSGLPALAVTSGYHLLALPSNRARVAADWFFGAFSRRQAVQVGLVRAGQVPLDTEG
jgi:NADH:ubiquinone reductase (H+-translocating)